MLLLTVPTLRLFLLNTAIKKSPEKRAFTATGFVTLPYLALPIFMAPALLWIFFTFSDRSLDSLSLLLSAMMIGLFLVLTLGELTTFWWSKNVSRISRQMDEELPFLQSREMLNPLYPVRLVTSAGLPCFQSGMHLAKSGSALIFALLLFGYHFVPFLLNKDSMNGLSLLYLPLLLMAVAVIVTLSLNLLSKNTFQNPSRLPRSRPGLTFVASFPWVEGSERKQRLMFSWIGSTLLALLFFPVFYIMVPDQFTAVDLFSGSLQQFSSVHLFAAMMTGLLAALLENSYALFRSIPARNIFRIMFVFLSVIVASSFAGVYGIVLAGVGMLSYDFIQKAASTSLSANEVEGSVNPATQWLALLSLLYALSYDLRIYSINLMNPGYLPGLAAGAFTMALAWKLIPFFEKLNKDHLIHRIAAQFKEIAELKSVKELLDKYRGREEEIRGKELESIYLAQESVRPVGFTEIDSRIQNLLLSSLPFFIVFAAFLLALLAIGKIVVMFATGVFFAYLFFPSQQKLTSPVFLLLFSAAFFA